MLPEHLLLTFKIYIKQADYFVMLSRQWNDCIFVEDKSKRPLMVFSCCSLDTPVKSGGNIWLHGGRVLSERACENLSFSVYPQTKLKEQCDGMASFTSHTLLHNQ